jgi:hypothetical protein
MQERCRNKTTLLDERVKFKRQQVSLVNMKKDEKTAPQLRQATSLRHG